jgi:Holliday junction resolvasome RuvABC endonuclease subunit
MIAQPAAGDKVIVAGIDAALRNTGVAIKAGDGLHLYSVKSRLRGAKRLADLRDQVYALVVMAKPVLVAIEGYSLGSTGRWFDIGEFGGVLKLLLEDAKIPLIIAAPTQLKKFVSGAGTASKERMIEEVTKKYGVMPRDDNQADACGLAMLAYVYLTGDSRVRTELEVIRDIKNPKKGKKMKFEGIGPTV